MSLLVHAWVCSRLYTVTRWQQQSSECKLDHVCLCVCFTPPTACLYNVAVRCVFPLHTCVDLSRAHAVTVPCKQTQVLPEEQLYFQDAIGFRSVWLHDVWFSWYMSSFESVDLSYWDDKCCLVHKHIPHPDTRSSWNFFFLTSSKTWSAAL